MLLPVGSLRDLMNGPQTDTQVCAGGGTGAELTLKDGMKGGGESSY